MFQEVFILEYLSDNTQFYKENQSSVVTAIMN